MGYPKLSLMAPLPIKFHGDPNMEPNIEYPLWWAWNQTSWRAFIEPCDELEVELYGNTYSEPYNGTKSGLMDGNNPLPLDENFTIDVFVVGVRWKCRWQSLLTVLLTVFVDGGCRVSPLSAASRVFFERVHCAYWFGLFS